MIVSSSPQLTPLAATGNSEIVTGAPPERDTFLRSKSATWRNPAHWPSGETKRLLGFSVPGSGVPSISSSARRYN